MWLMGYSISLDVEALVQHANNQVDVGCKADKLAKSIETCSHWKCLQSLKDVMCRRKAMTSKFALELVAGLAGRRVAKLAGRRVAQAVRASNI